MTASGPVGQMSKSTTELPAGRLNSEEDAGEGITLSSPETNGEGSVANADEATTGRVRNIANARFCAWVIKASSDWTQAILEHAAPNSGESRISRLNGGNSVRIRRRKPSSLRLPGEGSWIRATTASGCFTSWRRNSNFPS